MACSWSRWARYRRGPSAGAAGRGHRPVAVQAARSSPSWQRTPHRPGTAPPSRAGLGQGTDTSASVCGSSQCVLAPRFGALAPFRSRPARSVIARSSANLAFRIAAGAARLAALYLATHAVGAFVGWQVMAEAEPARAAADEPKDEDDEDDEDDAKTKSTKKSKTFKSGDKQPDARLTRITRYNAFCPTCVPQEATPEPSPLPGGVDMPVLEFPDAVRTQLPLALVATMEAEAPGISLATISQNDGGTGVYAEGDEVLANVTLLTVDLGIVYLRTATRVEYLQLSSDEPPPKPGRTTTDTKKKDDGKTSKSKYELDGASDAIKCDGMSCTVERRFVQQLLANPAVLATQGNARPYERQGLSGFRLSRVRKGTLPRLLGLRTGDLITAINGQPLNSLDGAMKLYAKLRNASHLTVDMVRNKSGTRHEMRLDIQII
ncbi:MAG: type II secretion system protein GspC [Myxococcota bacterium]